MSDTVDTHTRQFKDAVTEYVALCDTLKPVANKVKLMKQRMKELEECIKVYMKENTLQVCRLPDHTGLKFCSVNRKATVSKRQILEIVGTVLSDQPDKHQVLEHEMQLLKNEIVQNEYLKRC